MANKQMLHELLKEDQEPFRLKTYIADRKSQMKNSSIQLRKRSPVASKRSVLSKHACFLSFQNSPDVRRSPFLNFQSPAKSPNNAVFLHIPSRTAALLVEAAMRVQKPPSKSETTKNNARFGLFGSFLKRLKDRSRKQKRAIENSDFKAAEETVRISWRSCSNRRLSSAEWTENNEDKSMDFEASTSSSASECSDHDFALTETRFCSSPFRFSLQGSPSPCGRRTPEFRSPAASPSRHVRLDERSNESRKSENVERGEEEEEKEQCSPVSVLDPPFDEDDGHESGDPEEDDDYDLECSYENVQRAKQQLLHRLRRFEKLAELDPMELERKILEGSDEEDSWSGEDEPLSLHKKQSVETFVSQYQADHMKRLVSDLMVEERRETVHSGGASDVVMGRIRSRFDLWKEVEFNTIDMMVGLDLKGESEGWTRYDEQIGEATAEIEVGIFALLIEELSDEFWC